MDSDVKKHVYIINIVHYIGVEKMIDIESFIGVLCMSKNTTRFLYIIFGCIIGAIFGQGMLHNDRMMILFAIGLVLVVIVLIKEKKLK